MPFIRFNAEGSKVEEASRARVIRETGLVRLRFERRPTTALEITMTPGQAIAVADVLRKAGDGQDPDAGRRP